MDKDFNNRITIEEFLTVIIDADKILKTKIKQS